MWRSELSWRLGLALLVSGSLSVAGMSVTEMAVAETAVAETAVDERSAAAASQSLAESVSAADGVSPPLEGALTAADDEASDGERERPTTVLTLEQLLKHATVRSTADKPREDGSFTDADAGTVADTGAAPAAAIDSAPTTQSQSSQQRPALFFSLVDFVAMTEAQDRAEQAQLQVAATEEAVPEEPIEDAAIAEAAITKDSVVVAEDRGVAETPVGEDDIYADQPAAPPLAPAPTEALVDAPVDDLPVEENATISPSRESLTFDEQPQAQEFSGPAEGLFARLKATVSAPDTEAEETVPPLDLSAEAPLVDRAGEGADEPGVSTWSDASTWSDGVSSEAFSPIVVEGALLSASDDLSAPLQLGDAVRRAIVSHPAIAESMGRLDQQGEQVAVARAGYWPQVSTGINTGYRHSTGRSEEAFTLSASQMLYDFGKVSNAVDAASRGVEREEAGLWLTVENLIRETAHAFIEARRYEVLLELATEQIDAIADLEALATKRSALGASTASDQIQARSRREAARATQLQMKAQRDQWHRTLEKLIGVDWPVTLAEEYPAPLEAACPNIVENFEAAPRVIMAEAGRAEAQAVIRQARADMLPTLSLSADFEHYLNREDERLQQLDDQEFIVSLNLTSSLFQGGALSARRRAADHALRSATAARDAAVLELSRLYRESRDRSASLASSLTLQDDRLASITRTQELYRHQYLSLGTRTLLDILNTEQEIFQTRQDKHNTLFDLRRLQIDCLYSIGELQAVFRASAPLSSRVELSSGVEVAP